MTTIGETLLSKPDGLRRIAELRSTSQRRIGYTAGGKPIKPLREKRKGNKS